MHSPPTDGTAHSSTSRTTQAHGRSHSLSDPRFLQSSTVLQLPPSSPSPSAFEFHHAPFIPEWQYAASIIPNNAHFNPDPSPASSANTIARPHATPRAASPQSMVSSGSPRVESPVTPSDSASFVSSRATGKKPSIDRNRKPCGACSSSKRKCKLIPGVPNLCERCKGNGLSECPPYVPWSTRKAGVTDGGSHSPLDVDESVMSSRSGSPSYFSPSPVTYPAAFHGATEQGGCYPDMSTHEWVHGQTQDQPTPGSSSAIDFTAYETVYPCRFPNTNQLAHIHPPQLIAQNVPSSNNPPVLPVCHNCQTPYNEYLMIDYALQLQAAMPSPTYELDQSLLKMYGHVPPRDDPFKGPF